MENPLEAYALTFGGCLVAICVSFIFYGITTVQFYIYMRKFPNDSLYTRWTVILAWILETAHTGICVDFVYQYLIIGFGDLTILSTIYWGAGITMAFTLLIVILVHSFFIHRIWILSRRCIFAVLLPVSLLIVHAGFSCAEIVLLYKFTTWVSFHDHLEAKLITYATLSLSFALDICVTLTSIWYLHRGRTGFQRTDKLINMLEAYVVNSGALTILASLSILLTFTLVNGNIIYAGLVQIVCKFYNNALLATLNSRKSNLNRDMSFGLTAEYPVSYELSFPTPNMPSQRLRDVAAQHPIEVLREVTMDVASDDSEIMQEKATSLVTAHVPVAV